MPKAVLVLLVFIASFLPASAAAWPWDAAVSGPGCEHLLRSDRYAPQPESPSSGIRRGSPALTGVQPGPGPSGPPRVLWFYGGQSLSSPIVSDGLVWTANGDMLVALDAASGTQLAGWQPGSSGPTAIGDTLYTGSYGGLIAALDLETEQVVWQQTLDNSVRGFPTVAEGLLFLGTGGLLEPGSIFALDAATGAQRWSVIDLGMERGVEGQIAYERGIVVVPTTSDTMALNASTGEQCWTTTFQTRWTSPTVADGKVLVQERGEDALLALDLWTGELLWKYEGSRSWEVAYASVVVVAAGNDDKLHGLDVNSGAELWQSSSSSFYQTDPVVAGDSVYALTDDRQLASLDLLTGVEEWRVDIGNETKLATDGIGDDLPKVVGSSPAVSNGMIFVAGEAGIYALG